MKIDIAQTRSEIIDSLRRTGRFSEIECQQIAQNAIYGYSNFAEFERNRRENSNRQILSAVRALGFA